MPKIDVRGAPGGGGVGGGAGGGAGPIDPNSLAANRIKFDPKEAAATEMRLRKMVREYDGYLLSESQKTEQALARLAERGAADRFAADKRRIAETTQAKAQKDREYQGLWKNLLNERERAEKTQRIEDERARRKKAAEEQRTQREAQREQLRATRETEREQARATREAQRAQQRQEQQEQRVERQRAHMRRERVRAFGFGAMVGGVVGGATAGDMGGVLGAVGGGIGGGLGFLAGSAFGPAGGMIGKTIGSAIGSLAGVAVNPYSAAYRASKPYLDFQESTFALGRMRGDSGDNIDRTLFDRGHAIPFPWEQAIGIGPTSGARALHDLGYVPQGDIRSTLTTIGNLTNKTSAFAGLSQGDVTGLLGRGGAYGINAPNETGTGRMQGVVDALAEANARGLDKSRILDSINSSLDSLVSLSGNRDIEGITKLTTQLMATGTAGGMTGATARGIVAGNAAVGENILGNNIVSTAMTALLPRYNMLKTKEDVARMAGVSVDSIPESAMNDILSAAKNGRMNAALRMLASPAVAGAGRIQSLLTEAQPLLGIPGDVSSIYGTAGGGSLSENQGYKESLKYAGMTRLDQGIMKYNGNNPAYASAVEDIYRKRFGSNVTAGYDAKIGDSGYMQKLTAAGIAPGVAAMIVKNAKRDGLNPMLLASVGLKESGLNPGQEFSKQNANGTYDYGMFQINTVNKKAFPGAFVKGNVGANVAAGADILRDKIKSVGGFGDQGGSNVATAALRDKAMADQGDLREAFISLKTLEPAARMFTGAVDKFQRAVEDFVHGAHKENIGKVQPAPGKTPFERAYNSAMSGMMGAGGGGLIPP